MVLTVIFCKLFQFKADLAAIWHACHAIVAMVTQLTNSGLPQLDT